MNSTNEPTFNYNETQHETTTALPENQWPLGYGPIEQYWEFIVAYQLHKQYLYILSAIGIPGNLMSLITIATMKPLTSSSLYVMCLAVADTLALIFKLLFFKFMYYSVLLNDFSCKLLMGLSDTVPMYANWVLVAITAERCIAVRFPLKVRLVCTKKNAMILMGSFFIFFFAYNGFFWWGAVVYDTKNPRIGLICALIDEANDFYYGPYGTWIDATLYTIAPSVIITVLNGVIIYGMIRVSRIQKSLSPEVKRLEEMARQQRQITYMLIGVSISFVLLTTPNAIFFVWDYLSYSEERWANDLHYQAQSRLGQEVVSTLSSCNHAINFCFYFLAAKKFRTQLLSLLCCSTKKRRKSPYTGTYVIGQPKSETVTVNTA